MEESRFYRCRIDLKVCKDECYCHRVSYVRLACLPLLVAVCLERENKSLLHLEVIFFDILLVKVCGTRIIVVKLYDLLEFLFQFLRDLGPDTVVLKISAFGLSLHFLLGYGIKFLVILALSHLVFSYIPQNH